LLRLRGAGQYTPATLPKRDETIPKRGLIAGFLG
jgi:hypothetical protein